MDIVLLIKSGFGLTVLLIILVYLLFLSLKDKPKIKQIKKTKQKTMPPSLSELYAIVKDKNTDSNKLKETLQQIIKYYGKIPKKAGVSLPKELCIMEDIIYLVCRHPSVTSQIVLEFISGLEKLNNDYKAKINNALTRGLNSRIV